MPSNAASGSGRFGPLDREQVELADLVEVGGQLGGDERGEAGQAHLDERDLAEVAR